MLGSVEQRISNRSRQQLEAGVNKIILSKTQGQAGLDNLLSTPMDLTIAHDYPDETARQSIPNELKKFARIAFERRPVQICTIAARWVANLDPSKGFRHNRQLDIHVELAPNKQSGAEEDGSIILHRAECSARPILIIRLDENPIRFYQSRSTANTADLHIERLKLQYVEAIGEIFDNKKTEDNRRFSMILTSPKRIPGLHYI